jgi:SsrA-binding protein
MAKPKPIPTSSKPAKKPAAAAKPGREIKVVSENRKARHEYEVLETLECGIMLAGSEVKSLRDGKLSLDESYARVKDGDLWLLGADIAEYPQAALFNHKPKRPRKLLVHKIEFRKFAQRAKEKGLTLVPLRFYFNERGLAKVQLGLCKGKKLHDKRETLKKSDAKRDIDRAMRKGR